MRLIQGSTLIRILVANFDNFFYPRLSFLEGTLIIDLTQLWEKGGSHHWDTVYGGLSKGGILAQQTGGGVSENL